MHRPTRRPHPAARALLVLSTLALLWPAGVAASGSSASAADRGSASAPPRTRGAAPTVIGRGIQSPAAGRGQVAGRQLQQLTFDRTMRPTGTAAAGRPPRVVAPAPAPVPFSQSTTPVAQSTGWAGINQATQGGLPTPPPAPNLTRFEPPDSWVAAGPNHVVQTVNTMIRITNRAGTKSVADEHLFDFFQMGSFTIDSLPYAIDGVADPRMIYDNLHDRWIATAMAWHCDTDPTGALDFSDGFLFGALSLTNNPTGDYYYFVIDYNGAIPDYPTIGTSADKIAFSANEYDFDATGGCINTVQFSTASMLVTDWANMEAHPAFPASTALAVPFGFTVRPALQPAGSTNTLYGVAEKPNDPITPTSDVYYFTLTGSNAAGTAGFGVPPTDLTTLGVVTAFKDPPAPFNPVSTGNPTGAIADAGGVSAVDRRPTDAIWQDNRLTFPSTYPCDPAGGIVETRDCARVTQLDTSTATPTLRQDMLIATTGRDTWFPGVVQAQTGALHVIYNESSDTEGVSSFQRYQLTSDPVRSLSAPILLGNGGGAAYPGDRWGDFTGVAQDPRDTNAVWQAAQYTRTTTPIGDWTTNVSELNVAGSVFVPIPPVRLLDSRVNAGTIGKFAANVAKSVQIATRGGIPANAVAITGNLTVVKQTKAGFLALTPRLSNSPKTSTMNFPAVDVRANNITSPLSPTGTVSIVYKAVAGATTDAVLDVTGYFLNQNPVTTGATYHALPPVRVLDSRDGTGGISGPVIANVNRTFPVANTHGIPATATAITGNLTVVGQTAAGYVTVSTDPAPLIPTSSTINFRKGDIRANGLTVKLHAGTGALYVVYKAVAGAQAQIILDVTGYYVPGAGGARFVALSPGRRLDTRVDAPPDGGFLAASAPRQLAIWLRQGVPASAVAVTGNLTVVGQTKAGYLSVTKDSQNPPLTSTMNFPLADIRANGVTTPLSATGSLWIVYRVSSGSAQTHVILDLTGYFR